jgi:hypothetical protein
MTVSDQIDHNEKEEEVYICSSRLGLINIMVPGRLPSGDNFKVTVMTRMILILSIKGGTHNDGKNDFYDPRRPHNGTLMTVMASYP